MKANEILVSYYPNKQSQNKKDITIEDYINLVIEPDGEYQDTVFLPVGSLLPRTTSIIDVTVLKQLMNSSEDTVPVFSNGTARSIRRSCLSALISEINFEIENPKNEIFNYS